MKKRRIRISLYIITAIFLIPSLAYSAPVDIETAKQVAINLYSERSSFPEFSIVEKFVETDKGKNIFYIFNFDPTGFVFISADDIVVPILGYSFDQNYGLENHPPQFDEMVTCYKEQIVYAIEKGLSATMEIRDEWSRLNVASENFEKIRYIKDVSPLLSTTWNQGQYYNEMCPYDESSSTGNNYVWAGCVATAMAQVMKYWNHPTSGTGSHSYTPSSHPEYGTQSANFGTTTYNWANMPNNVNSLNTDVQTLLYHCGVSVEMNYGPYVSGAWIGQYSPSALTAFETYFKYDTGAYFALKSDYSDTVWEGMIRIDLDNGRPLVYRGYNSGGTGGHAFNLDGYQGYNYFHFNWGWSGNYNGYYYLTNLNPGSYNFTTDQGGILELFPDSPPVANFEGNPTSGYTTLTVLFTDQSSGIIDSWYWSFQGGNPSSASDQGPHQVEYNNSGSYDVSLAVLGPGGSDIETKYDYIIVSNPYFPPPENLIAEDDYNGYVPLNWNQPSPKDITLEGYKVYRSLVSGSGYDEIYQINNPNITYYNDDSVTNGTTYYYVVTATYSNPTGESAYSNEENGTPQGRFTISGYVIDNESLPLNDVLITLSGYENDTEYTNEDGEYDFCDLVGGKYYMITPSMNDWTFDPDYIEFDPLESDQYNQDFIGTSDLFHIAGNINYCISGFPINYVILKIFGNTVDSIITNTNGYYNSTDLMRNGNYLFVPNKENDISVNCISAMDAAWVLKYTIGLMDFTDCQIAAGDVTGDGSVSAWDAAKILKYTIGLIDEFPVGKDWRFLPQNRYYQDLQQNFLNENYIGVAYGDVTHNWTPSVLIMKDGDTEQNRILSLNSVTGSPGEVVNIPVSLQNIEDAISARIILTYDATLVTFQEVNLTSLTEGFLIDSNNLSGEVKIAFAGLYPIEEGGDILKLLFEINENVRKDTCALLHLNKAYINEIEIENTIDANIIIKTGEDSLNSYDYSIGNHIHFYPNPFKNNINIEFFLNESTDIEIKLYNVHGQEVKTIINDGIQKGKNIMTFERLDLQNGIYFIRIKSKNQVVTKKILHLK